MDKLDPDSFLKKKGQTPTGSRTNTPDPGKKTLPEPPAAKKTLPEPPAAKKTLPEPPAAKKTLPDPPAAKKTLPDPPAAKKTLPDPPAAKKTLPDPPAAKKTLPDPPATKKALPDPPAAKKALPDPPAAKKALPDPPAAKQTLPDPPAAKQTLPDPPVAKQTLPDPPAKKSPEPPAAKQTLPDPPAKKSPEPPAAKQTLPDPSAKKSPEPPAANQTLLDPPVKKSPEPPVAKQTLPDPPAKRSPEPPAAKQTLLDPPAKMSPEPRAAKQTLLDPPAKKSPEPPAANQTLLDPPAKKSPEPPVANQTLLDSPAKKSPEPPVQLTTPSAETSNDTIKTKRQGPQETTASSSPTDKPKTSEPAAEKNEKEFIEAQDKDVGDEKSQPVPENDGPTNQERKKSEPKINAGGISSIKFTKDSTEPNKTPVAKNKKIEEPKKEDYLVDSAPTKTDSLPSFTEPTSDTRYEESPPPQSMNDKIQEQTPPKEEPRNKQYDTYKPTTPSTAYTVPTTTSNYSKSPSSYYSPTPSYSKPSYTPSASYGTNSGGYSPYKQTDYSSKRYEPAGSYYPSSSMPSSYYGKYKDNKVSSEPVDYSSGDNTDSSLPIIVGPPDVTVASRYYPQHVRSYQQQLSPRSEASTVERRSPIAVPLIQPRPVVSSGSPLVVVHPPQRRERYYSPPRSSTPTRQKTVSFEDYDDHTGKSSREVLSDIRARWQLDSEEERERRDRQRAEHLKRRETESELMEECETLSSNLVQKQLEVQQLSKELAYLREENQQMQEEMNRAWQKGDMRTNELMQVIEQDREMLEQTRKENLNLKAKVETDQIDIINLTDRISRLENQLNYLQSENAELAERLSETAENIRSSVNEYKRPYHQEENERLKEQLRSIEGELMELKREIAVQKVRNQQQQPTNQENGKSFHFPNRTITANERPPLAGSIHDQVMNKAHNAIQRLDEPREVSDAWFNKTQTYTAATPNESNIHDYPREPRTRSISPPRGLWNHYDQPNVASNEFLLVPSPRRDGNVDSKKANYQRRQEDEEISSKVQSFLNRIRKKDEEYEENYQDDFDENSPGILDRIHGRIEQVELATEPVKPQQVVPPWLRRHEYNGAEYPVGPPRKKVEDYMQNKHKPQSILQKYPSKFKRSRSPPQGMKQEEYNTPAAARNSKLLAQFRARARKTSAPTEQNEDVKKAVDHGQDALSRIKERYKDSTSNGLNLPPKTVSASMASSYQPIQQSRWNEDNRSLTSGLTSEAPPPGRLSQAMRERIAKYRSTDSLLSSMTSHRDPLDTRSNGWNKPAFNSQVPRLDLDSIVQDSETGNRTKDDNFELSSTARRYANDLVSKYLSQGLLD